MRHQGDVRAVAFRPDGKAVLTGSYDKTARLWSAATGKELTPPMRHQGDVRAVAFRPDGKAVLTGSWDGTARLWSAATGKELTPHLRHQGPVHAVAFRPDGKAVLTGCGEELEVWGEARLWSAVTGKELTPPLRHQGRVTAVAFRPDGKAVLTGSDDGTARLWLAATGKELTPPMRHEGYVYAVAFSPDGKAVLTGSTDGRARLWRIPVAVKGNVKRITVWTQVITGTEMDDNGNLHVLDAQTWQRRRQQFMQLGGSPTPEEEDVLVWHRREAIEAELAGQWFAAAWHLTRLLEATPDEGQLWQARAEAHAHLANWEKASWDWLNAAMAQQKRGHTEDAKSCLAKAGESMKKAKEISWLGWLKLQILYHKAEGLVKGAKR
jgi:dipeptidyl aminopeptidase/acylaminoacyl peptidase